VTRRPSCPPAFAAAPAEHADLLVVVTPGAERFEYLRELERIAEGTVPHVLPGGRRPVRCRSSEPSRVKAHAQQP
jgi:hypothetical protein